MSSGAVGKRYAKALFEVAADKQQLDLVEQDLLLIDQVLAQNPAFIKFLQHPQLDKQLKKKELKQAFEGNVSETVLTFMNILIDSDREDAIAAITESYIRQANEARGLVDAKVTSIKPLTDEEKSQLSERYSQLLNKKIRIHNEVDPTIIGGVIVQIGDRLYDGSVRGKLYRFKRLVVS